MNSATVLVKSVELKEGISQKTGKPFKRVVLTDGNDQIASSFDAALYDKAKPFENQTAIVDTQPNGNFTDLIDIREAPKDPKPGTGEYVTGQKPVIDARRIAASTAAHVAGNLTGILINHQTGREISPELVRATYDAMEAHVFTTLVRRGNAIIEDEDIPF